MTLLIVKMRFMMLMVISLASLILVNFSLVAHAQQKLKIGLRCELISKKFKVDEVNQGTYAKLIEREIIETRYHLLETAKDNTSTPSWLSIDETNFDNVEEYGYSRRYLFVEPTKYHQFNDGPETPLMGITRDTLVLTNVYILEDALTLKDEQYLAAKYQCSIVDPAIFYTKAKEAADLFKQRQKI